MAEVVALRAILLNVLFKLRKARERFLQAPESEGQRKEKS
jgi:hypothetical protein